MELKYLQTLKTITEAGSFAAAAKRLNYTQSTVTFHIQQLEKTMHVALFEKSAAGWSSPRRGIRSCLMSTTSSTTWPSWKPMGMTCQSRRGHCGSQRRKVC